MSRLGRGYPNSHPGIIGAPQAALGGAGGGGTPGTGKATVSALAAGAWVVQPLPEYLVAGLTGSWAPAGLYVISGGAWA